jgi:hypothetical protein
VPVPPVTSPLACGGQPCRAGDGCRGISWLNSSERCSLPVPSSDVRLGHLGATLPGPSRPRARRRPSRRESGRQAGSSSSSVRLRTARASSCRCPTPSSSGRRRRRPPRRRRSRRGLRAEAPEHRRGLRSPVAPGDSRPHRTRTSRAVTPTSWTARRLITRPYVGWPRCPSPWSRSADQRSPGRPQARILPV